MKYLLVLIALHLLIAFGAELTTPTGYLTNAAQYEDAIVFPTFINDTIPFVQGAITGIVFDDDTNAFYLTTTTAVVRLLLSGDGAISTDYTVFDIPEIFVYNLELFVADHVNNLAILFGTPGDETRYAFFDLDTFAAKHNSLSFPALTGVIDRFIISDTVFVVVSTTSFVRFEITGAGLLDSTVYADPNLSIVSADIDIGNKRIYLGVEGGKIHSFNITSDDFSEANQLDTIQLPTSNGVVTAVSVLFVDETRTPTYLYAATLGNPDSPSTVHRIDVSTVDAVLDADYWKLGELDFSVVSGAINRADGFLFLIEKKTPGRVVQISFIDFNWEQTIIADLDGPNRLTSIAIGGDYIYVGGSTLGTLEIQLNIFYAPYACDEDCFGNGDCADRTCTCDSFVSPLGATLEFEQPWCQFKACDLDCNGHASECLDGNCTCWSNFTGTLCDVQRCPNNCIDEEHGTCEDDFTCTCEPGFTGDDCSGTQPLPCPLLFTCEECTRNLACGWCPSAPGDMNTSKCFYGNPISPNIIPSCDSWHFAECPAGIVTIAAIILSIMGLLLTVNLTAYATNYAAATGEGDDLDVREEWYTLQRANKWWTAYWQIQLIGATMFISGGFPTILTTFLGYFQIFIYAPSFTPILGNRTAFNQTYSASTEEPAALYLGYSGLTFDTLSINILLGWIIIGLGSVVTYSSSMIGATISQSGSVANTIVTRPVYIFLRFFDIAILPFALVGGLSISYFDEAGGSGILGAIFIAVDIAYIIIIGVVFTMIQQTDNIATLYQPGTKGRFLFLYGTLKKGRFAFAFISVLKRFLLGLLIGVLYFNALGQIIAVVVIVVIFAIISWVADYDADHYQKYTETGVALATTVAFLLLLGFINNTDGRQEDGATAVVLSVLYVAFMCVSLGICFTFYFFNWFQKEEQFSFSQVLEVFGLRASAE